MRGSIQQRGAAWRVVVDLERDPATGKRRQIVRNVKGTKREAEAVLNGLLVEARSGVRNGQDATVNQLLDTWLEQARLSPSTRLDYGRAIRSHVPEWLSTMKVWKVRPHHLDGLYGALAANGVGDARVSDT